MNAKLRTEPVFPVANVVRTDCDEGDCAERQPLPAAVAQTKPEDKTPAQWAYERMIIYLQKFEEGLDPDQEVGMGFAGSDAGTLHIMGMGFFAPDMITFYGVDQTGAKHLGLSGFEQRAGHEQTQILAQDPGELLQGEITWI